jgi:uncharacterized tellurite resistance protein B-like protein
MAVYILDKLNRLLGNNPSVRKVADDLQMTSELILLVRVIFADGKLSPGEMEAFKKLCREAFALDEEDIPQVLEYLKDFGYETTAWDAAQMFKSHPPGRKRALLLHMLEIAKADNDLDASEAELIRKTAQVLGMTAEEIRAASGR